MVRKRTGAVLIDDENGFRGDRDEAEFKTQHNYYCYRRRDRKINENLFSTGKILFLASTAVRK